MTQPLQLRTEKLPFRELSFNMIEIPEGTFQLKDGQRVTLSSFQLGQNLVNQALWEDIMGNNPSNWKGKNRPVESVSWYDCVEFCNQLSKRMEIPPFYEINKEQQDPNNKNKYDDQKWLVKPIVGSNGFRLPTEAEWEFAARGGGVDFSYPYSGSQSLVKVGWYDENSFRKTHIGGLKLSNIWGLYEMSGHLWEWCWDWYSSYPNTQLKDPIGDISGQGRVLRGGSWGSGEQNCGVAIRTNDYPDNRRRYIGFRLSRTAK